MQNTLISKQQFRYYEPGEFSDIENRSLKETIALIGCYPWEQQRDMAVVGPGGPSITIEGAQDTFLKIGLFYNDKFVLYFVNEQRETFAHVATSPDAFEPFIEAFFGHRLDGNVLSNEREWSWQKGRHFVTRHFAYSFRPSKIWRYLFVPIVFTAIITAVFLFSHSWALLRFVPIGIIPFFWAHWILIPDYYSFSKNIRLEISAGTDAFRFGTVGSLREYRKQDIDTITITHNTRPKCGWSEFKILQIGMKNGETLTMTNLLISDATFAGKFPQHKTETRHKFFAWIKRRQFENPVTHSAI